MHSKFTVSIVVMRVPSKLAKASIVFCFGAKSSVFNMP